MNDKQAILEATTMAIVTQGGPSYVDGSCKYRGPDGRKCAIGLLIADDFYEETFEGFLVSYSMWNALYKSGVPRFVLRFLFDLQQAHDTAAYGRTEFWESWTLQLRRLCEIHDLEFPGELI